MRKIEDLTTIIREVSAARPCSDGVKHGGVAVADSDLLSTKNNLEQLPNGSIICFKFRFDSQPLPTAHVLILKNN